MKSIIHSHLDLAHHYWSQFVQFGDNVIDATCGNGRDTLKLCQLALSKDKGKVYAFDRQAVALQATHFFLKEHLDVEIMERVELQERCHSTFPEEIAPGSIQLIVYNLGYLPGGDKSLTTLSNTTLQSVQQAQHLLKGGGLISITCYPGHCEGAIEQEKLLAYVSTLSSNEWKCCHHVWINRPKSPNLLLIEKNH